MAQCNIKYCQWHTTTNSCLYKPTVTVTAQGRLWQLPTNTLKGKVKYLCLPLQSENALSQYGEQCLFF